MKTIIIIILILIVSIAYSQRRISEEAIVFSRTKDKVFTVFGNGHGSGFLINHEKGLILTNDHVIANSKRITVQLDADTKVHALLIENDKRKDLAIISIHPSFTKDLSSLPIAVQSDTMIFVGERVIAIGSPLNQVRTLTSGIVSNVDNETIISDININPGNSGGPLINMIGEVIGVNTFGDFSEVGPGLSGSIKITEAFDIIDQAEEIWADKFFKANWSKDLLPIMPKERFPLNALEKAAQKKFYDKDYKLNAGKFRITFLTPPYEYHLKKEKMIRMASKRESPNKDKLTQDYDVIFSDLKNWMSSVGEYKPVVFLIIEPSYGETAESQTLNACGSAAASYSGTSYYGSHSYEFKSDVENITLKRNGAVIEPIISSLQYISLDFKTQSYYGSYSGEDLAQAGFFIYPIDAFLPSDNETIPIISIDIVNHMDNQCNTYNIPENTIYKINVDFEPYTQNYAASNLYKLPQSGDVGALCAIFLLIGLLIVAAGV